MAANLTLLEDEWTRQPHCLPRISRRFRGNGSGFCFLPSLGFFTTDGSQVSFATTNTGYSGPRFGTDSGGSFIRHYADHGGLADDKLKAPFPLPTAKSGAMTTIISAKCISSGYHQNITHSYESFGNEASGHKILLNFNDSLIVGYEGNNGYDLLSSSLDGSSLYTRPQTIVVSTTPGQNANCSMSGVLASGYSGLTSYIGQGNISTVSQSTLGCGNYAEYYNFNGHLYLWAQFPGVFLSASEVASVSINPWQIFEPEEIPLFKPVVTAQYARPTSDVSTGTWTASTGSDLFAMLDETSANDIDYITTTSASTCEVALGSLTDPAVSTGHIVRYRISSTGGGITVRLRQGTTTIASWTHSPAPTSLTTYAKTLSGGEADSITNYAALKLQFEAIA